MPNKDNRIRVKFKDNSNEEIARSPYTKKAAIASPYLPDRPNSYNLRQGVIWAEILSSPVSKRKGRARNGF